MAVWILILIHCQLNERKKRELRERRTIKNLIGLEYLSTNTIIIAHFEENQKDC